MSKLNNPAGRLHQLLIGFDERAGSNVTINDAWIQTLEIDPEELLPTLGQVAALIGEVHEAVARSGRQELAVMHAQFASAWAVPIFTHGRNPSSDQSGGLVSSGALAALGVLAVTLEMVEPDGDVPDAAVQAEITLELQGLLEALSQDGSLDPSLRAAIAARIHDILWAINHVRIVGPPGVEAAVERLVGQLAIFTFGDDETPKTPIFTRTMNAAARVWGIFRVGSDAHKALEGWQKVFELLPPG